MQCLLYNFPLINPTFLKFGNEVLIHKFLVAQFSQSGLIWFCSHSLMHGYRLLGNMCLYGQATGFSAVPSVFVESSRVIFSS